MMLMNVDGSNSFLKRFRISMWSKRYFKSESRIKKYEFKIAVEKEMQKIIMEEIGSLVEKY